MRKAAVSCSLYHIMRASSVSARTLDASCIFFFFLLSRSLSGSLRACFFYIRSVDDEQNLFFLFFFFFFFFFFCSDLVLVCEIEQQGCAGEWTFPLRGRFSCAFTCILTVSRALGQPRLRKIKQLYILASSTPSVQ